MSRFGQLNITSALDDQVKDVCGLAGTVAKVVDNVVDKAKDVAGKAVDKVQDIGEEAIDAGKNAADTAKDVAKNIGKKLGFGRRDPLLGKVIKGTAKLVGGTGLGKNNEFSEKCTEVLGGLTQFPAALIAKLAGSTARALGIQEYYSVHIGVVCVGSYEPDPFAKNPKINITDCTTKFHTPGSKVFDFLEDLQEKISSGPFNKIKLIDTLRLPEMILKALKLVSSLLTNFSNAFLASVLALALAFIVLCLLFVPKLEENPKIQFYCLMASTVLLGTSWLIALVASGIITWMACKIEEKLREYGPKFGIVATRPPGVYVLLWSGVVLESVALAVVTLMVLKETKARKEAKKGRGVEIEMSEKQSWNGSI